MFEQAQQAMAEAYGGGKVNPDRLDPQSGRAPETSADPLISAKPFPTEAKKESQSLEQTETQTKTQADQTLEDILDLANVEGKKIKIGDETFTLEDLQKSILRHKDYTKKTQALSQMRKQVEEEQKFADAFEYDLEKLLSDPEQYEEQFRSVYPEKFQKIYDRIKAGLGATSQVSTRSQSQKTPSDIEPLVSELEAKISPKLQKVLSRIEPLEKHLFQLETEKEAVRLDSFFTKMHQEFDLGSKESNELLEDIVLARAQGLGRDPSDAELKKFFSEGFQKLKGIAQGYQQKQFESQRKANQQAKDVASGGGVASKAPVTPKTLKEARDAMEQHLRRG